MSKLTTKLKKWPWLKKRVQWSQRATLPGLQGLPIYEVINFFIKQLQNIGLTNRAAAISFNLITAIPAGLIFICTLIPFLPNAEAFRVEMMITLSQVLADEKVYNLVANIINDFFNSDRTQLISISFLAAMFFSSNAMMGVMETFDRSYFEKRPTHPLAKRWTAIKLTFLLIVLMFASGIILITQGWVKTYFMEKLGWNSPLLHNFVGYFRWLVIFLLTFFCIAFIYRFAPAIVSRWKINSPGAIIATTLTIFTSAMFSLWVQNFGNYNKVYGSIGTVLILLNLVFINALILIVGFEINVSITSIKQQSLQRIANQELEDKTIE